VRAQGAQAALDPLRAAAVLAWLFTRTQPASRIMVPVDRDRSARQPARQGRTP